MTEHPDSCGTCGRTIAPTFVRYIIHRQHVVCIDCMTRSSTNGLHTLIAPDCPFAWHDAWDHSARFIAGPRDGIAHVLETGAHQ